MKNNATGKDRLYLGVDVGGTKVQASLVHESGGIVERERRTTPRTGGPEQVLAAVEKVMDDVLKKGKVTAADLTAVGIAVPGVVDPDNARVVVTPNMSLTGVAIGAHLESRFHVPVAVGNDGNLGTLGETWLGSARQAKSALGICVGTGIGAGLVQNGKLWRGARESAGEIGHIVMQIGGPKCGCGNCGCLEALASRTAIERDIRDAIAAGRTSMLSELTGGDLSVIRSGAIRRALEAEDPLVTEVLRHASEVLGYACLTVRHLIDPEVIVLGGGVIEACSDFMMPIIENIVGSDRLPGARDGGQVLLWCTGAVAPGASKGGLAMSSRPGTGTLRSNFSGRTPSFPSATCHVPSNDIVVRGSSASAAAAGIRIKAARMLRRDEGMERPPGLRRKGNQPGEDDILREARLAVNRRTGAGR